MINTFSDLMKAKDQIILLREIYAVQGTFSLCYILIVIPRVKQRTRILLFFSV